MDAQNKLEFENAFEMYRQRPCVCTGKALLASLTFYVREQGLASYGPCLAILATIRERKHYKQSLGLRFSVWFLTWQIERTLGAARPPKRPAWNDYYMVRWQLTKEQRWANEIHHNTHYDDPNMVGFTANWMAASQRSQDEEFNRAMSIAEVECGCKAGV